MRVRDAEALESYIVGLRGHASAAGLASLRPGCTLRLQAGRHSLGRVEVLTERGEPLGWLPPEDALAISAEDAVGLAAQVTAIVPARLLPRIHVRVAQATRASLAEKPANR